MSFQQGLSGLNASSKALDVVGNNVANSSTVGFKSSSGHFADVYAASLSGSGASQVGIGTSLSSVFQQFTQGNITTTNNSLDVAINGGGFFKVTRDNIIAYTRNGQFHADNQGYIINDQNYRLMGYVATATGQIVPSEPAEIRIDTSNIAPQATGAALGGNAEMVVNLDSSKEVPSVSPFNYNNPLTYTFSTAQTVYDTLGVDHNITYYFVKTATAGEWDVYATLDGANPEQMDSLTFDTNGQLTSTQPVALPTTWAVSTGAATPLGSGQPNWNLDFTGSTSYSGDSTVNSQYQGGYAQGALSSISIGPDGIVLGNYSNGQTKNLAQIVLTTFPNSNGLINLGNNLYQATSTSGEGLDGAPGAGSRGVLQSAAVEESNVDLTAELVNMITLQRNYQANAQSIKTQDQIMQTLVNLR
ncbi:flagellar hook protein FlgE [Propionivibrio sp.]|jgi:flagellar hook protein FlgE|uniref:flagellar hook protein FlgE n=1 Tax=Propionivibrio sp. TaxID=2212460 RepID=UPI00272EE15E|nr:flagellar hook protein FlgE [Propionivibrio sp.]